MDRQKDEPLDFIKFDIICHLNFPRDGCDGLISD